MQYDTTLQPNHDIHNPGTHMLPKDSPILLVDDSLAIRQIVKNVLVSAGYTDIQSAADGKEALAKIKGGMNNDKMYKVIFLDWNMPEMDGLEFLKVCRGDLHLNDIAIVMLTAVSDQKSVVTALSNGATAYITKPVSSETVLKRLDQIGKWFESQGRSA